MSFFKRIIINLLIVFSFSFVVNAYYYEPNSDIQPYLDTITESFIKISSYSHTKDEIPSDIFLKIKNSFAILKDKLPQIPNFKIIYENCYLSSQELANGFEKSKFDIFTTQCFGPWKSISRQIFNSYSVHAKIKAYPSAGNAPLTVTFDGRSSFDPSSDTIPKNNYYWYYKDSNGVTRLMGQGPVIKYTFNEANDYVVHLTVRSSNKGSQGILDGFASKTISVSPPIANLSLYINGQRAYKNGYIKLSSEEGKNGVLFDASGTTPSGSTKITSSYWIIKKGGKIIYKNEIPDYPGAIRVKLLENGIYFVTLGIKDNTGKKVEGIYKLIVSNPVAIINVNPKVGNTSTKFVVDGSPSYSVNGKILTYKWTIVGPDGNKIDSFENKKHFTYNFYTPGIYAITLEVEDVNGDKNMETYKLNVESTPPVANFIYEKYDNWEKASTFVFDASYSSDVDEKYGDKLSYFWHFSNSKFIKTQSIDKGKKLIAQFNKKGTYKVSLTVKDKYGKTSSITKTIKIESTLRPQVSINPNYTILGQAISIKVKTNKPVDYYEYFFGDGKNAKTQSNIIEHTYTKVGVYNLKVIAFSVNGDSNSITKKVFIGQRGYPLAIYDVYKKGKEQIPSTFCNIKKLSGTGYNFMPAYEIERMEDFTINAKKSVNGQGTYDMLSIYFRKEDSNENILKSILTMHFDELGCQKIDLYVIDLNTNKIDKKTIYFKVVDAKPILKDINMYFPQYAGPQLGNVFQPQIGNNIVPQDLFKAGFDPLLVKLVAIGAKDPDSPVISHYRWYYYKEGDKSNLISVKQTPYNINQVVFSLAKIPGKYIFGVDVCDVDGECTNSEEYLKSKLIVNIPPDNRNPDIPQVNSVRIDRGDEKGVGEVNVGDDLTITVNSEILSKKKDFYSSRTIKYDFDNDGKYDLVTKKDKVHYSFKKSGKYRVKVKVIYRGYGGIGYSSPIVVKKGLKPMIDIDYKGKTLIYNDLSLGDIKEKFLCFSFRRCKTDPADFLVKKGDYGIIHYENKGYKFLIFKVKDAYGNEKIVKKKIYIKEDDKDSFLLTLPKYTKDNNAYKVITAGMYNNYIILYYASKNKNCYIDKNITIDSNNDKNTTNDKDLSCNIVHKLEYNNIPEVSLMIHDGNEKKILKIQFPNFEISLPSKYKKLYKQIQVLIDKYSKQENNSFLVKLLSDLLNNLDDKGDRDSILLQLDDYLKTNNIDGAEEIQSIISQLSDLNVKPAISGNLPAFDNLKTDIQVFLEDGTNDDKIEALLKQFENSSSKDERKDILQKILNIGLDMKKSGKLNDEELNTLKKDICNVLEAYKIPSQACGTGVSKKEVQNDNGGFTLWSIVKIIGWILAIFVIIFIIIVVIFIIKAKINRQKNQEEE